MSSVNSASSGVAALLQTFYSSNSALPSALSSSTVQSALQQASPGDLVQLSAQALQLQQVTGLFGGAAGSDASGAAADSVTALIQALETQAQGNSAGAGSGAAPASTVSSALPSSLASESLAQQEAADLFGANSGSTNSTISLLG
jgi:hypothetical protein